MTTTDMSEDKMLLPLFSEEDVGNIHKILGFSCLGSFAYRYYHLRNDGNFGPNHGTLVFLVHHFLLHVSSFIFALPKRRILSGYRIWPEARLHAMVFTCRSFAFMLLFFYEDTYRTPHHKPPLHWMNLVIILCTHASADAVSNLQEYPSRTIRDLQFPALWKWFFSTVQFVATGVCLVGARRYNPHLNFIFVIQFNAFLMTLRRRDVASHTVLVYAYAIILIVGVAITIADDMNSHLMHSSACLGIAAAMLRLNLGVNKFVLWTGMSFAVHQLRQADLLKSTAYWAVAHALSWAGAMALGYYKTSLDTKSFTAKAKAV
ncbi:expressed unknown protein [Seminavis robusta]|uniref:Uncharacterized protein n=1 Tax=Seminavis robusta TaxID=568900 RepID=A0A9N8HCE7_9STRA|nr:expressed unknown protein [Seminavis robusta]|eukprot:Sro216_g089290.1 n/a (318) ;mRNA; f:25326-26279